MPVTLATGTFVGNKGDFALTANGSVVSGNLVIGSCTFVVTTSTFSAGQGLQVGDRIVLDPCQIDAIDRRLIVTNAIVSATPTISSPPVLIPPDITLNLPTPPPPVIDEDTSGSLQITAAVSGVWPGTIVLGITIPPAHGTATLTNTGVLTYQPEANFTGSDRLVVTVVVRFTDNDSPALLLGTVPIDITMRPAPPSPAAPNTAPTPTAPAINILPNTPGTSQISANAPDVGDILTFTATKLPAHGTASVNATGLVTYTPNTNFIGTDSLVVTVTDNATPPLAGTVTLSVTVTIPGAVSWIMPASASVASGQTFPLTLAVADNFQEISGEIIACPTTVSVDRCLSSQNLESPSSFSVQVTPSSFSGPPGTFAFTAQGVDCAQAEDIYFVARLFLLLPGDSTFLGPFFSPQTTTTLQAATGPVVQVSATTLTFNAFAGLDPPPQTLFLTSACGQALDFTGASNVPWLSVTPTAGTISGFGPQPVAVAVDVTKLNATQSPFMAMLTFTGAFNSSVVTSTLNLVGP
jgi:hypothetical protein